MNVLLHSTEYRPNLSSMIRSAEFYGFKKIYIYDSNQLLQPPSNKVSRADMNHMARVWTAGAIEHIEIEVIKDIDEFLENYPGRTIATLVNDDAVHLNEFQFEENDLLIFGSEKNGLPEEAISLTSHGIYIPAIGQTPCLNVAVTFGIVVHQAMRVVEAKR